MTDLDKAISGAKDADELLKIVVRLQPEQIGFALGRKFSYVPPVGQGPGPSGEADVKGESQTFQRIEGSVPLRTILKRARELEGTISNQEVVKNLVHAIDKLDKDATELVKKALAGGYSSKPDFKNPGFLDTIVNGIKRLLAFFARAGNIKDSKEENLRHFKDLQVVLDTYTNKMNGENFTTENVKAAIEDAVQKFREREEADGSKPNIGKLVPKEFIPILKLSFPVPHFWERHAVEFSASLLHASKLADGTEYEEAFKDRANCLDILKIVDKPREALKFPAKVLLDAAQYLEVNQKEIGANGNDILTLYKYAVKNGFNYQNFKDARPLSFKNSVYEFYLLNSANLSIVAMSVEEALSIAEVMPDPLKAQQLYRAAYEADKSILEQLKDGDENAQVVYAQMMKESSGEGDVKGAKEVGSLTNLPPETIGLLKALANALENGNNEGGKIDIAKLRADAGFRAFIETVPVSGDLSDLNITTLQKLNRCFPFPSFWSKNAVPIAQAIQESVNARRQTPVNENLVKRTTEILSSVGSTDLAKTTNERLIS
jgi:hypothetical protein